MISMQESQTPLSIIPGICGRCDLMLLMALFSWLIFFKVKPLRSFIFLNITFSQIVGTKLFRFLGLPASTSLPELSTRTQMDFLAISRMIFALIFPTVSPKKTRPDFDGGGETLHCRHLDGGNGS